MSPSDQSTKSAPVVGGLRRLRQGQLSETVTKRSTAITSYEQFAAELDTAINDARANELNVFVLRLEHRELPGSVELGGRRRPVDDEIARRLQAVNADMRTFAISRSELVAFVPSLARRTQGEETLRQVCETLTPPITVEGLPYYLSPAVGGALLDRENTTVAQLVDGAGLALSETDASQPSALFHPYQRVRQGRQVALERTLCKAILGKQIEAALQPAVKLESGRIVAFEAYARWIENGQTKANATEFVALARSLGMLHLLTHQVLERGVHSAIGWIDEGLVEEVTVWANVQPEEVTHPEFFPAMANLIGRDSRVRIGIELSPCPAGEAREVYEVIKPLVANGARAAIGDFGIGQANLSVIEQLPFDSVKLDLSLIRQIAGNKRARDLVKHLLDLATVLNLEATAQGIEDEAQADMLRSLGCPIGQGFHFVRPALPDDLLNTLAQRPLSA